MADIATLAILADASAPSALGFNPAGWVGLSMAALIVIALLVKVPSMLLSGLDANIEEIRKQLAEAKALRAEADVLRQEYADKIANAEKEAAVVLDNARNEAAALVNRAEAETTAMIVRREKMAEDRIAAAQNSAVAELRAKAADAATEAAKALIAKQNNAANDQVLVGQVIGGI